MSRSPPSGHGTAGELLRSPAKGSKLLRDPMSEPTRDPLPELALALLLATVAVTCATTGEVVPLGRDSAAPASRVSSPSVVGDPSALLDGAPMAGPVATDDGADDMAGTVAAPPWRATLDALANGARDESVHLVWLGDSHTAADFWTHTVREEVQTRYGNGGPGFLRLGISPYRHGRAKVVTSGRWRRTPTAPARAAVTDDGVFGIGGMRAEPVSADARVTVELHTTAVGGEPRWDIAFRFRTAAASFAVTVDDEAPIVVDGRDGHGPEIRHLELAGKHGGELSLGRFTGRVELFGLTVESSTPGVVLDTIGIDGARIATLLAWDEGSFRAELARRRPDFVVLAFGTNEAFAEEDVERYPGQYAQVIARIRAVVPDVGCVIIGPTDVPGRDGPDGRVTAIDRVQARAAESEGCAFVSLHSLMGGDGSFARWARSSPPLAAEDGVHLLNAGYERLGSALVERLVGAE
ncbi:MAG: hypothetical protein JW751_10130 [Polyangiaceae bacterium]|nr:hypothetical protein [Polyangiaceae bacterium]